MRTLLSGNEAIARGAWEAGCNVAAAYPGTPSTEILENIGKYPEIYAEWSTNEKVAFDVVAGASFAGARVLVAMKHVGLNVAADPFFTMSYSGVTGGFVIVCADDPGMWSSQNEQDNRWYALAGKVPMLEPSDSQEAKDFTLLGFKISEEFDTPVLLRLTTRVCHSSSPVKPGERSEHTPKGYVPDIKKRLFLPAHGRVRHRVIEQRLIQLKEYSEKFEGNKIEWKDNKPGIISSGIASQYAKEVFPTSSFLKLSMTHPLPAKLITDFASKVDELYVIEEGDAFIENQVKALGIKVIGKEKVPTCGELDQSVIRESFNMEKEIRTGKSFPQMEEVPARPPVLCPGCSHRGVFYILNKLKLHPTGDIGCYTLGALPPLSAMETCICMGASIGNAYGIELALGKEIKGKMVAVIGDSTFFHTGIPSLVNVVYNKGYTTIIVLDNLTTAMTGHQPHPGTGKTLKGEDANKVLIEDIVRGIGVKNVYVVDPYDLSAVKEAIKREVQRDEPSVIIARRACALMAPPKAPLKVNPEICTGCKLCMEPGCPAITMQDDKAVIEPTLCNGCGLCAQVCVKEAIGS